MLMDSIVDDPRWAAVLSRDAGADGRFVYSVASTGVYCRPNCAARTPHPLLARRARKAHTGTRAHRLLPLRAPECRPAAPSPTRHSLLPVLV